MSLRGVNITLLPRAEQKWLTQRSMHYLNRVGCSTDQLVYIRSIKNTFEFDLQPVKPRFLPELMVRRADRVPLEFGAEAQVLNTVNEIDWPGDAEQLADEVFEEVEVQAVEEDQNNRYTHDDIHDLELRYSRCLCKYKGEVYYLDSFRQGTNNRVDCYILKPNENFTFSKEKLVRFDDSFDFTLPKLGYVNTGKYCLHLLRNHKRSDNTRYRRGFTTTSVSLSSPSKREIELSGLDYKHNTDRTPLDRIISSISPKIFNREYPSYNEALDKVLSFDMLSCAFSTTWCIKLDSISNKFILLKNNWLIGEYNPKEDCWNIVNPSFNIELDKLDIKYKYEVTE